jgi:pyrroline-5-carboxylate reductase
MISSKVTCLAALSLSLSFAQAPAGWKTVHDKTNACQVSVPPTWKMGAIPSMADAPADQGDLSVSSHAGKTVKPFSDMTQKALMVDKMIKNTPQMVFYSNKPTASDNPITPYSVTVPGKGGTCSALISVRKGVSEEEVKKIADTLSASK